MAVDLLPRLILRPPGGAVVIDPWAAGGGQPGTILIGGVAVPYEIVWGPAELPPTSEQIGATLGGFGLVVLVVGAAWLLGWRRR